MLSLFEIGGQTVAVRDLPLMNRKKELETNIRKQE